MTDVIERLIEPELTAPDVGSVEAKARVFHFIRRDLALDASQLVESLGTSRPEQVCVRITSALSTVEIAELYDFAEHCGRAGSVFSLDIIMSEDADVEAHQKGEEGWLGPIISTTEGAVKDNIVRWIIPILPQWTRKLEGLHELARAQYARPVLILPHHIGQDAEPDAETKSRVVEFIQSRILGPDSRLYGAQDLDYYQSLADHLSDPIEHPQLDVSGLDIDQSETLGFRRSGGIQSAIGNLLKLISGKSKKS